jgi:hypothetical protein
MTEDPKARRGEHVRNYKKRSRLQNEISSCLRETADEDLELTEEFSATTADGL